MAVSYNKLWNMLHDRKMMRKDLKEQAGISRNVLAKMSKGQLVAMDSMEKICLALQCDIGDVMEFVPDEDPWNELLSYAMMPQEERDAIIDSGCFNSIIEGYMVLAMRDVGVDEATVQNARGALDNIFDWKTAADARKALVAKQRDN